MNGRGSMRRSHGLGMVLLAILLGAGALPTHAGEQPGVGPTVSQGTSEVGAPVVTGLLPTLLPLVPGASGPVTVAPSTPPAPPTP